MRQEINFFAEDPERYTRFQREFLAQNIIENVLDEILWQHSDLIKERDGEERDLSRLVGGFCFGKAYKTFHAIVRLCALGLGEDATILLRSNINLLININFILKDSNPIECSRDFINYSFIERMKYIDIAHEGKRPEWMRRQEQNIEKIKLGSDRWRRNNIEMRAKRMGDEAFLLHYTQGYRLYSSLEHADVMALSGYIHHDSTSITISSEANDEYISVALAHNFRVMSDLLITAINYFNIECADLVETLHKTWQELVQYDEETSSNID